jgi:hypothetical protein
MKQIGRAAVAYLGLALASATVASGHHSQAMFDLDNHVTLEGRIVQINWASPHSLFFLEGRKIDELDSEIQKWAMEGPSPVSLTRTGWTKDLLKVGDRVTAKGSGSRSGRPLMLLRELTTPDGKVWHTEIEGNFNRRLAEPPSGAPGY